jgi:hypothetical protein
VVGDALMEQLSGHDCTEATSGTEIAKCCERAEGNAGGVRLERRVRPLRGMSEFVDEGTNEG